MDQNIKEKIQQEKELLYLNALKVANQTLAEAEEQGYEVSSGLLSSSASLLKLSIEDVIKEDDIDKFLMSDKLKGLLKDRDDKAKSPHYKDA